MRLCELPVGAKVSDYKRYFPWIVADQSLEGYPGTVLISDFLAEAGCYDAPESGSRFDDIRQFGWNRYPVSNVHQWLNSTGEAWFTPMHPLDEAPGQTVIEPYEQKPGFLWGFSHIFVEALRTCSVVYAYQDDYYQLRHGTVDCRVFLPSRTELGVEKRAGVQEGRPLQLADYAPVYRTVAPTPELVSSHRLCDREFHPSSSYPYWLRSIELNGMSAVYFYGMSRAPYFQACQGACGIRPMVVMESQTVLEEQPDAYGVYWMKGALL